MEMSVRETIGKRIEKALEIRGIKQKELAQHLGLRDNMISYFVSATRTPNHEQLIKIARFLNVSTDYLYGITETHETDKDTRFICDATGLNEEALKRLQRFLSITKNYNVPDSQSPTAVLNALLSSDGANSLTALGDYRAELLNRANVFDNEDEEGMYRALEIESYIPGEDKHKDLSLADYDLAMYRFKKHQEMLASVSFFEGTESYRTFAKDYVKDELQQYETAKKGLELRIKEIKQRVLAFTDGDEQKAISLDDWRRILNADD